MPVYRRPHRPGATIFFTVALRDRSSDLLIREVDALRAAVREVRADRPFRIDAWVVLPDHLHAVWTLPEGDAAYPVRWAAIKARVSRGLEGRELRPSDVARRENGIWQRRFWEHHIRDEADLTAHVRYCWWNPVKHDLVAAPTEWPHSSIHRDIRAGRVDPEWTTAPSMPVGCASAHHGATLRGESGGGERRFRMVR